jgi:hypothetical protein
MLDKFLIFFGTVAALLAAAVFPLMFTLYGKAAGTLLDFQMNRYLNQTGIPVEVLQNKTW